MGIKQRRNDTVQGWGFLSIIRNLVKHNPRTLFVLDSVLVNFSPIEITFKDMYVCNMSVYVSIEKLDPA